MQNRDTIDFLKPENRFNATPMDLLRQGILRKQWNAVEACYLMLTGEQLHTPSDAEQVPMPEPVCPKEPTFEAKIDSTLSAPTATANVVDTKRKRGRPRKKKPEVPVSELPKLDNPTVKEPESEVYDAFANCTAPARLPGTEKKYTRASTHDCRPHPNTFTDDMTVASNEIVQDRKVPKAILENKRPPTKNVKVKCNSCGGQDIVDIETYKLLIVKAPGVKHNMAYRCNNCIVGGGSPAEMDLPEIMEDEEAQVE
jgi:hypothetical protein